MKLLINYINRKNNYNVIEHTLLLKYFHYLDMKSNYKDYKEDSDKFKFKAMAIKDLIKTLRIFNQIFKNKE